MSNFTDMLIQSLGYSSKVNETNTNTSQSINNLRNANNISFAALLSQLERNLSAPQVSIDYSSLGYIGSNSSSINQSSPTPISAIAQKIKENDNPVLSVDDQVAQYLLDHYGGNKAKVIMSLSGAQSLPTQANALQNQIFQTIVSKIATQVRSSIYTGQDLYDTTTDESYTSSAVTSDDTGI